jgi:hypothetical protein
VDFDHIATVIVATPMVVLGGAAAWWLHRRTKWGRGHVLGVTAAFVAVALLAIAWSAYTNIGIRETEYASLNDAYELAPIERRPAMRRIAKEAASRREIYSMSYNQRDRFLHAGGYCRWSFEPGCAPPPRGTGHWLDGREALEKPYEPLVPYTCDYSGRCTTIVDDR